MKGTIGRIWGCGQPGTTQPTSDLLLSTRKRGILKYSSSCVWGSAIVAALSLVVFPDTAQAANGEVSNIGAAARSSVPSQRSDGPQAAVSGPAGTQPSGSPENPHSDNAVTWRNWADIQNLRDDTSRSTVAFQVNWVESDDLIAQNSATVEADCVHCRSVAFAFQVGLLTASAPVVKAENKSLAVNERRCDDCVAIAMADQFLLVTDKPLRLTASGRMRLRSVEWRLRKLARSTLSADVLRKEVDNLHTEVIQILSTETRQAQRHGVLRLNRMEAGPRGRHSERHMQPAG
jgi:hypothetical protein